MDEDYIKENVGQDIVDGLVALVKAKPQDAVEFLGNFLVNVGIARETGLFQEQQDLENQLRYIPPPTPPPPAPAPEVLPLPEVLADVPIQTQPIEGDAIPQPIDAAQTDGIPVENTESQPQPSQEQQQQQEPQEISPTA